MTNKVKIVVARYKENIDWVKQFPNVTVYNKGEELNNGLYEVLLENVGREGHTYYKYIVDNYYTLDDYTVFLQGNPFDHSPNIITNLYKCISNKLDFDFAFLSENILHSNLKGCPHHPGLPLIEVYEKIFQQKRTNMNFIFGAGAQFIVSKQFILKRPISFYQQIVDMLSYSINPIEGYVIERLHLLMFIDTDE